MEDLEDRKLDKNAQECLPQQEPTETPDSTRDNYFRAPPDN